MSTVPPSVILSGNTSVMLPDASEACALTQPPTTFPLTTPGLIYTHASYNQQPVPTSAENGGWRLCLSVPIPSRCIAPTLKSLVYIIKYASSYDNGNSTVQTDTILTTLTCPEGITFANSSPTSPPIYLDGSHYGYGPHIADNKVAMCLSTVPAIKYNNFGSGVWNHYIDHHRIIPNIRIIKSSNLYLNFHVFEYYTVHSNRALFVEVSATWLCKHDIGSDTCKAST